MRNDEFKYIHLWVVGKKKVGRATVCYRRKADRTGIEYAVSMCSPNDEYKRSQGRELARKRFESGDVGSIAYVGTLVGRFSTQIFTDGDNLKTDQLKWYPASAIVEELNIGYCDNPGWARGADFVFAPEPEDLARYRPHHKKGKQIEAPEPITTTIAEISEPRDEGLDGGPRIPSILDIDDTIPF